MTRAAHIAALIAEARAEGSNLALAFAADLEALSLRAAELVEAGDAVPVGVRELASRVASDARAKSETVRAILSR